MRTCRREDGCSSILMYYGCRPHCSFLIPCCCLLLGVYSLSLSWFFGVASNCCCCMMLFQRGSVGPARRLHPQTGKIKFLNIFFATTTFLNIFFLQILVAPLAPPSPIFFCCSALLVFEDRKKRDFFIGYIFPRYWSGLAKLGYLQTHFSPHAVRILKAPR